MPPLVQLGASPLSCAVAHGHLDTAQLLITAGADPNGRTLSDSRQSYERTPLLLAAHTGHVDMVKLLLKEVCVCDAGRCHEILSMGWPGS